jgi:hypothetical protein
MRHAALFIDGEPSTFLDDPQDMRIQLETDCDAEPYCAECGEQVYDDGDIWEGHDPDCSAAGKPPAGSGPTDWLNSAHISTDSQYNTVTVGISIGDPRGSFTMTIRRNDDGTFTMFLPYPGESLAHMETEELQPGTLRIK